MTLALPTQLVTNDFTDIRILFLMHWHPYMLWSKAGSLNYMQDVVDSPVPRHSKSYVVDSLGSVCW